MPDDTTQQQQQDGAADQLTKNADTTVGAQQSGAADGGAQPGTDQVKAAEPAAKPAAQPAAKVATVFCAVCGATEPPAACNEGPCPHVLDGTIGAE